MTLLACLTMRWMWEWRARGRSEDVRPDGARSADDGRGWMRRLARYCWRYRRNTLIALGGAVMAGLVTAAIPLVQRQIIDNVIVTHKQSIWPLAITLVVLALLNFVGIYLRRYRGGGVSLDVQHDLRTELLGALTR